MRASLVRGGLQLEGMEGDYDSVRIHQTEVQQAPIRLPSTTVTPMSTSSSFRTTQRT